MLQRADDLQHLRHVLGGTRLQRGRLDTQRANVLVHGGDHLVGQRADGDAALDSAFDDLVINVSDVAHISDLVATGPEPALHHVKGHHHAGVADVAEVVNRHAADVHADMARHQRRKFFELTRERVVNAKAHEWEQRW